MTEALGPEVLGELFDAQAPALVLYARQWCGPGNAEDAVQEAFIALAGQKRAPANVLAWLHAVVRKRAISGARGRRRRERHEATAAHERPCFFWADEQLSTEEASTLLQSLEGEQRQAVVARIWAGLNFEAIASLLGCSLSTAHRRYHDGLEQLRLKLEEPCRKPEPTAKTP